MELSVEYVDQAGEISARTFALAPLVLLKHVAVAGRGNLGLLPTLARGLGALLYYQQHLNLTTPFPRQGLREMDPRYRDPTEKGDFSTIAGKGIADFLARRLLGALHTHSYEAAMHLKGLPLTGERPDFYCVTRTQQFAMEAKGFSKATVSAREMAGHIRQAKSGPLVVHFAVASVAHNLYRHPRCKFHDPVTDDAEYDSALNDELARLHYVGLMDELSEYVVPGRFSFGTREFMSYDISPWLFRRREAFQSHLLLDARARESPAPLDLIAERVEESDLYIDVDGVGARWVHA